MKYALLGQSANGLEWLANGTLEELRVEYDSRVWLDYDFVLVTPLAAWADIDGHKPGVAPLVLMTDE